jgi:hypothetical protein
MNNINFRNSGDALLVLVRRGKANFFITLKKKKA